jgi:predicted nucleic acid-binding protein
MTAWVLTEVADALSSPVSRQVAAFLYDTLIADPKCTILTADHRHFEQGWQLYHDRQGKSWSLTDCISFMVMQEYGQTEALTADHHFE